LLGHARHIAVGRKRSPIGALHESRFSVFTQCGTMACQGWRWIYVRLRQGLRCECRRKRNAESNHKSVCDKHNLAPDFFPNSVARPSHELGPSAAVALTGNVPIKSGCRQVYATSCASRQNTVPGDVFAGTLRRQPRNTISQSFVPSVDCGSAMRVTHSCPPRWTVACGQRAARQLRFPVLFSR
jgi:hypothetical protein